MEKCVQRCIGKYIWGSGLDEALVETVVFGKKVIQQVLNGTCYIRSLRAILIFMYSINRLKWEAFWENNKNEKYKETPLLETFYYAVTKNPTSCFDTFTAYKVPFTELENDFTSFSNESEKSQMSNYLNNILHIANL